MFLSQFGDSASVVHINNLRCRYLFDIENFLLHLVRRLFQDGGVFACGEWDTP